MGAMASRTGTGGIDAAVLEEQQHLEVSLASMETRLRTMIKDIMQPTIAKTSNVLANLETMKGIVSQHTRGLQEVQLRQLKCIEQVSTIASFKEDMSRWDSQRRIAEVEVEEALKAMQQKLDACNYSLQQKESVLHHLHRSVDRTAMEVNRLQDAQETQREQLDARIDEQSRKINEARSEIDVRICGLELKHNALTDQLWGEETGLAKVAGELKKTNASFATLEASVNELKSSKAEAAQLDRLRSEVGKMLFEANSSVGAMRQTVGNVVNDVREHFRTASETISAHNATFIVEVRQQYQAELAQTAKLRAEVQDFMKQVERTIESQDARVAETAAKASALAAETREEVEELNRRRKRDKTSADNELKALKKRLGGVFDNSDAVQRGIEHLYDVLQMLLESDFIGSSLEIQDTIDKKQIALIGTKDQDTALARNYQTELQRPRPECRSKSAPGIGGKAAGGAASPPGAPSLPHSGASNPQNPQEPVVRVDKRCLSCSGQAPLVLAAFKMACLRYEPSPVDHDGALHERSDLLHRRHVLLAQCRAALHHGPEAKAAASGGGAASSLGDAADAGGMGGGPLSEYNIFDGGQMGQRGSGDSAGLRLPLLRAEAGGGSRPLTVR